jgi:hypothetical protein
MKFQATSVRTSQMKEWMILFRVSVYFRVFRGWTLFAEMNRSVAEPAGCRQRRAGAQFQIEDPWLGLPEPGRSLQKRERNPDGDFPTNPTVRVGLFLRLLRFFAAIPTFCCRHR